MRKELKSKDYRHAYAKAFLRNGIAFQIHGLRTKFGWSQTDLGDRCGMKQNAISRLEDPEYGKLTFETLAKLAEAFDVAPFAGFISFSELDARRGSVAEGKLVPSSYDEETSFVSVAHSLPTQSVQIGTMKILLMTMTNADSEYVEERAASTAPCSVPAMRAETAANEREYYVAAIK